MYNANEAGDEKRQQFLEGKYLETKVDILPEKDKNTVA